MATVQIKKNVVIIGPCGEGKSSLINMLCPTAKAPISNSASPCTWEIRKYTCSNLHCEVYDTIGLTEEIQMSWFARVILRKKPQTSLEAKEVGECLEDVKAKEGGVHLLIYCMSGQRCKKTSLHKKNYKRFKDVVGDVVPVVVVVTGLDTCHISTWENREICQWWSVHGGEKLGMDRAGHVCITTQPPDPKNPGSLSFERQNDFYNNSCVAVKNLVEQYLT